MRKLIYLLIILLSLVGCQPFDFDVARGDIAKAKLQKEYSESFAENFGVYGTLNIDENHTWGFYDVVDSIALTRSANVNANQWLDWGLDVPQPLTQAQKDTVTHWFENHQRPTGIAVNWTDYFAQQVSSNSNGSHMDYLLDKGPTNKDHINNFNRGDGQETNITNDWKDKIQYMSGQSTVAFGYHESVGQNIYFDHYVIIPGETIDPSNAYGLKGMYFVGFDYESYKSWAPEEDRVERDYYFNDWIIKITPGKLTRPEPIRIMAEDLGAIGDFDFNDVVFDVYLKPSDNYGLIILQAAGGTMPLYVNDYEHEVHDLFGVDVTTIVNTEGGTGYSISRPIVQWSFEPTSANAIDIPIYVDNTRENIKYEIKAERGTAPGKFAVPTTVKWSPECINIKITWPKFQAWVEDEDNHFWE